MPLRSLAGVCLSLAVLAVLGVLGVLGSACERAEPPIPTDLRWADVQPLIDRTCIACHSRADTLKGPNAHGVNLETYERVKRHRKGVYESVVRERTMPPDTLGIRLTEEERARLSEWLRGGAPQ